MPKQIADRFDADAASKQPHGEGCGATNTKTPHRAAIHFLRTIGEDRDNAVVLERLDRAADSQD